MSAREQLAAARRASAADRHQRTFRLMWGAIFPDITLAPEAVIAPIGRWRFDFVHNVAKVAIEIQGGIWMRKGAHNTGEAILRDTRKARAATLAGWSVFHICPEDIDTDTLAAIARFIMARAAENADPYEKAR